jgi:hypothetical protein
MFTKLLNLPSNATALQSITHNIYGSDSFKEYKSAINMSSNYFNYFVLLGFVGIN